jgi:alanyl aminopeptidase
VGTENFRTGIQQYLRRHAWRNAKSSDLMDSIGTISKQGVTRAFSTFLNQSGVPLVSVRLKCDGAPTLELAQKRFVRLGSEAKGGELWQIPMCVKYSADGTIQRDCMLLAEPSTQWKLSKASSCPAWVQANADGAGYYRVNYEGDLLQRLINGGAKDLTAVERVALLGNVSALATAGQMRSSDALALVPRFANDPERQVVISTIQIASSIRLNLVPERQRANYRRFITKAYGEQASALGWIPKAGEDPDATLLRAQIVPLVAQHGDAPGLVEQARALTNRWFTDRKAIDPNVLGGVLSTAAAAGDRALFDRFVAAFQSTQDRRVRQTILSVLGDFHDSEIARHAQSLLLTPEFDLREAIGILVRQLDSPEHIRRLPFQFLKQNFDAVIDRMPTGTSFDMGATLPRLAAACDESGAREVEQFFAPHVDRFTGLRRTLAQQLERIRQCAAFKAAQQPAVVEFLEGH